MLASGYQFWTEQSYKQKHTDKDKYTSQYTKNDIYLWRQILKSWNKQITNQI